MNGEIKFLWEAFERWLMSDPPFVDRDTAYICFFPDGAGSIQDEQFGTHFKFDNPVDGTAQLYYQTATVELLHETFADWSKNHAPADAEIETLHLNIDTNESGYIGDGDGGVYVEFTSLAQGLYRLRMLIQNGKGVD